MTDVKKTVLITGSSGLIGSRVAHHAAGNYRTILTSRGSEAKHHLDLSNPESIPLILEQTQPEAIVNCAGVTSIEAAADDLSLTQKSNVESVKEMAKWCSKNGRRLVHFSTDFVFDGEEEFYNEAAPTNPLSEYGHSKLKSEAAALHHNENTAVIRTSLVYGYHPKLSRLNFPLFLKGKLESGESLSITADQFRSPTYADDLAAATVNLIDSDFSGIIHLAGPERVSVMEMAKQVAKTFKLDTSLLQPIDTQAQDSKNIRPLSTGLRIDLAQKVLDYTPLNLEDGLLEMRKLMLHE